MRRITLALSALMMMGTAHAADAPGSADHPLIGRFQGAEIVYYRRARLDEAQLFRAPYDRTEEQRARRANNSWLRLEGTVTQIRYTVPSGHSALEVIRSAEQTLAAKGFAQEFACSNETCFAGRDGNNYVIGEAIDTTNRNPPLYESRIRYSLSKAAQANGATYVSLLAGEFRDQTTLYVEIVEPTQPQAPPPPPKQADACARFAGEWKNVDPKTRSIAKATTTGACVGGGGKFVFKGWGACAGKFCEWDPLELTYDAAGQRLIGEQTLNYAREAFSITLRDDGRLSVAISTVFTDRSGRQPMSTVDILERTK